MGGESPNYDYTPKFWLLVDQFGVRHNKDGSSLKWEGERHGKEVSSINITISIDNHIYHGILRPSLKIYFCIRSDLDDENYIRM